MNNKNDKDSLGTRMKAFEACASMHLLPRMPMIIRVDGNAFHTMVKRWKCKKPFDPEIIDAMQKTMLFLCDNIQGAVLGYVQSDEISIGVIDYQSLTTTPWFDKKVQKMASIAAGMATKAFNFNYIMRGNRDVNAMDLKDMAVFDGRVFTLPKEEVVNYFLWRQQDASRNSVSMAARSVLSHKECYGLNCDQMQEAMFKKAGLNWNNCSTVEKRGTCAIKVPMSISTPNGIVQRNKWFLDLDIPVFSQNREYVGEEFIVK